MSDNSKEHMALTAAMVYNGRDLSNVFAALDSMSIGQLRRFATTCEWLAMQGQGELYRRCRGGK